MPGGLAMTAAVVLAWCAGSAACPRVAALVVRAAGLAPGGGGYAHALVLFLGTVLQLALTAGLLRLVLARCARRAVL